MCGLVGISFKGKHANAAELAVNLLLRLQHRGQDGAGVTVLDKNNKLVSERGLGLVPNALSEWGRLEESRVAIAHARYATTGRGGIAEIQPFIKGTPRIALAHNGNIVNTAELKRKNKLVTENESDLDVLQQVLLQGWDRGEKGFTNGVQEVIDTFNGGFAVVGLEENGMLFAFRDPFGIRPLFYGQNEDIFVVASETCALSSFPKMQIEELKPAEILQFDGETLRKEQLSSKMNKAKKKAFCMFESVYFSSSQSEVDKKSVFSLRFRMGQELAKSIQNDLGTDEATEHFDYVVPVPETARVAATAVAENLKVPYREYLVKNPYVPRTFILASQTDRLNALKTKLSLIGPEIKGQRILLVDDSVVRGNTSRMMCEQLKAAGARSVTLASTCPPIRHGCFYGIDFPDPEELVAHNRDIPEIAKELGVDGLYYLSTEALETSLQTKSLCMACLNGRYPSYNESFAEFLESRKSQRGAG